MSRLDWMKFYPEDWLKDTRALSATARGVWIDVLCYAHLNHRNRGRLRRTLEEWGRMLGITARRAASCLGEIKDNGVATVTFHKPSSATVICRRIVREERNRRGAAERQARFRARGGGSPERWAAIRVYILGLDDYRCCYCGRKARTVDHVIPRAAGGETTPENLVACCYRCNRTKSDRTPEAAGLTWLTRPERIGKVTTKKHTEARSQIPEARGQITTTTNGASVGSQSAFTVPKVKALIRESLATVSADAETANAVREGRERGGRPERWLAALLVAIRAPGRRGRVVKYARGVLKRGPPCEVVREARALLDAARPSVDLGALVPKVGTGEVA